MDKSTLNSQLERFRKGFPYLDIVAPATLEKGILRLSRTQASNACAYLESAQVDGRCKFVPASGAASRMFKDIFAGSTTPNEATRKLAANIVKFAFYDSAVFGTAPFDPVKTAGALLSDEGLGYGSKPKGVLKFHSYPTETRTALAEHFVEGQAYMRDNDGSVNLVVTISPEHRELFEAEVARIKEKYENLFGVRYNVSFTFQDKETDTVAVDEDNRPIIKEDGEMMRRPAGHGALIYNLNALDKELVCIKNIDNVCVERMQGTTYLWKKVLMGKALELRDRIFGYIYALDQTESSAVKGPFPPVPVYDPLQEDVWASDEAQQLCNEIEQFLQDELCISIPKARNCKERAAALRKKLDRPVRVCGMVRNEGEPGGGPFIIRDKDGGTSLQILEGAQINPDDEKAVDALKSSTHFNPVDIVCCLKDHKGERFNLPDFVDAETGLISSKSYKGKELKALELPGLWNGSMSDWNTLFVEVPIETFNPVKTVLDLLKDAHQ